MGKDRDHLRTLLAIDDAVVAIHAVLGAERADRAAWFVLSDNGFLINQHGFNSVKNVPYDPSVRVPMLARIPGVASGTDDRVVANIDLVPAILRAVGAPIRATVDG